MGLIDNITEKERAELAEMLGVIRNKYGLGAALTLIDEDESVSLIAMDSQQVVGWGFSTLKHLHDISPAACRDVILNFVHEVVNQEEEVKPGEGNYH